MRARGVYYWLALVVGWCLLTGSALDRYSWQLPAWVPIPTVPADNPMSEAKVELGRHLFYDKRLSADQSMSCATCHQQDKAFTDGLSVSEGVTGQKGARSAMALANVAYLPVLTWSNPNLTALEVQALVPMFGEHPVEMGMAGREKEMFARLQADPIYQRLFAQAYPAEARQGFDALYSLATVTRAIASFERSLLSFDSPYDRYTYGGQKNAMSASALRGEALFFGEKMECYHCHGGFNFTDNIQHSKLPFAEKVFTTRAFTTWMAKGLIPRPTPVFASSRGMRMTKASFEHPACAMWL